MAISDGTAGAWAAVNATTQTVTLPAHSAGDMLLVRAGMKHATVPGSITCATSGWTKLGQYYDSGGASSNGGGGVVVALFYKEAASSSEPNPVVTFHATVSATPGCAVAVSYSKGASENWVTPEGAGGAFASSTAISATMSSHISATSGDMLDAFAVGNDNNTMTVPTVTQAGLTLDTVTEYPATALSDSTSNDIEADGCNRLATAGTSSAAAVVTGTLNIADSGSAWVTRLRVQAVVIEALAGTSDAAATGDGAVTRGRGIAATGAEASDATLAGPTRTRGLAGTSDAVATGTGQHVKALVLAGTSAAAADASGSVGLPRALAGTSAAVAATPNAPLTALNPIAGTSDAVAVGTAAVTRVRGIAGTSATVADGNAAVTKEAGNLKPLAGTSDAASTADAALFRARSRALAGTATETATASANATKYRALAASAAASGAATGAFLRERSLLGASAALSDATGLASVQKLRSLEALAEAISSVDATLTVGLGLQGTSAAVSDVYGDTYLTVVTLERRRWDGTQWNPGELYRRRWTQT
jgi:hypothetical protein